ncbi:MAG: rod shape-determining protein MreC [Chitinophagaceae bacterium]|nr:MAG: rod shape-determining protein MreC [Chitinophagaceae bacterium]
MRNIFAFIRRHFVFLAFVALQFVALWMLFSYNRYHHAAFLGVATEVTGSINKQVDKVDDYFHLLEENRRVHRMNDSLLNAMRANFNVPDTNAVLRTDSVRVDSLTRFRRWLYRDAKVVYHTVNAENNYIQLNRGANQGIANDMAVISSDGSVVGIVINTSPNFCQVLSLLHTKSSVPAILKKSGSAGTVRWDTKDPRFLNLEGISKDVQVTRGDTVLTSPNTYNYPPNFLVGRVAAYAVDKATGFYTIKVQAGANFANLQQVFVIENLQRSEQMQLEKDTEKQMDQMNKTRPR